ncbi:transcriptional regulator [Xanthomonas bromi]|uniref:Transcriptional regulator n=1 Tax=Xanthomonas bromi TaxID=56449 RepID=A0A1C3NKE2_9XANT|nr:transcriptional regulator [Xanthomonas bromi]
MLIRSDFYPRLIDALPDIVELKRGDGHVDLLPPRDGEIGQIIRVPAAMAGLRFEEDRSGAGRLNDVLRDALPLLQHLLHALHAQRRDDGVLTFAAYRAPGGLEGALAHHADWTFRALPSDAQAALNACGARCCLRRWPLRWRWPTAARRTGCRVGRRRCSGPAAPISSGLALRVWAMQVLARWFTVDVAIQPDHPLVRRGPYRWLRHPSCTGALLTFYELT